MDYTAPPYTSIRAINVNNTNYHQWVNVLQKEEYIHLFNRLLLRTKAINH